MTGNKRLLGSKSALNRTLDVFKLQELSEDPDPHATLPFISHHTLNISRELDPDDEADNESNDKGYSHEYSSSTVMGSSYVLHMHSTQRWIQCYLVNFPVSGFLCRLHIFCTFRERTISF